jgi:hypothetical protein
MTDNTENPILEHLRAIRAKLDQQSDCTSVPAASER